MPLPLIIGGLTTLATAPTVAALAGGSKNNSSSLLNNIGNYEVNSLEDLNTLRNRRASTVPTLETTTETPIQTTTPLVSPSLNAVTPVAMNPFDPLTNISNLLSVADTEKIASQPATSTLVKSSDPPTVKTVEVKNAPDATIIGTGSSVSKKGAKRTSGRGKSTTEGSNRTPTDIPNNPYITNTTNPFNTLGNNYDWLNALVPLIATGGLGYLLGR